METADPKILWVALPLLAAAACSACRCCAAARRRAPRSTSARACCCSPTSATAGLGIFWVANQQLPVFDWHYLFGYGTVLLVSLHLVFNFPVVWRFFARRRTRRARRRRPARVAPAAAARRSLLGALGVLAATGAAFVLGLRHGRSELKVEPPSRRRASPARRRAARCRGATALALVERFHAFSSHSRAGVLTRAPGVDWGDPPPPFKRHAGAPRTRLPPPGAARAGDASISRPSPRCSGTPPA